MAVRRRVWLGYGRRTGDRLATASRKSPRAVWVRGRSEAAATAAARDTSLSRSEAARASRAALTSLPGFRTGDALASAILTAATPDRMAIYDQRAHKGLHTLGIALSHAPGRYSRYIEAIDQLLATAPEPIRNWTARDVDTALYWLNHPPKPQPHSNSQRT